MKNIIIDKIKENKRDMYIILGIEISIIAVSIINII